MGGSAEWKVKLSNIYYAVHPYPTLAENQQTRSWDAHVKQVIGAREKGSEILLPICECRACGEE